MSHPSVSPPPPGTKYRPLFDYLARQPSQDVVLSVRALESLIKRLLPKAAEQPDWWGLDVQARGSASASWRSAGYEATLEADRDTIRFRRSAPPAPRLSEARAQTPPPGSAPASLDI